MLTYEDTILTGKEEKLFDTAQALASLEDIFEKIDDLIGDAEFAIMENKLDVDIHKFVMAFYEKKEEIMKEREYADNEFEFHAEIDYLSKIDNAYNNKHGD